MKPAPFDYARADGVAEALALLGARPGRARVLAGGQSLLPLLAARALRTELLVDVSRVAELACLRTDAEGVHVGAAVVQRRVERDAAAGAAVPLLAAALPQVGNPATRNRGTVAGSVAFAEPAAELPAVLLACGGEVELASPTGSRTLAAAELFTGPRRTAVGLAELITEVRFPATAPSAGSCWLEFGRRPGDLPLVGVGVIADLDGRGRFAALSVACSGVHDRPWSVPVVDVLGAAAEDDAVDHVAAAAARACAPADDARTTAAHRRLLVATLVRRAVAGAVAARGVVAGAA